MSDQLRTMWKVFIRRRRAAPENMVSRNDSLITLLGLMEAGKIKSVVDRTYPLEQAAEAHRFAETGQKKGNLVIIVN